MANKLSLVLSAVAAALSLSCGGGGGGLACDVAACGGDPVGAWTISGTCFDFTGVDVTGGFCPEATATADIALTGTVAINADNSYDVSSFTDGQVVLSFPGSCLSQLGITDCAQMEQGNPDVTCTGDPATSCACTQTIASDPNNPDTESGTWSTSGNTITLTSANGTSTSDYCVQGNNAVVRSAPTATAPGSSIILTK